MTENQNPPRPKPEYSSLVPAVEQASRILLTLAQASSSGMSLTEICAAVGIHKSKGYSILNTLQHFALAQRSPHAKTYSLGPGLLFLSSKVLEKLDIREAAAPFLQTLSRKTNSTAFFALIAGSYVFVVAKDEGIQDVGVTIRLGHRFPLAWGAHGKAIAAFLPERERAAVLTGAKLYFHGHPSNFDPRRLDEELAECRARGFATDLGDMKQGIHAVASPVFGLGGKLVGSVAVMGTFPADTASTFGLEVARAARELSKSIGGLPENAIEDPLEAFWPGPKKSRTKQEK
jgi:DNA-binding IclR family transcriptional regulator